MKLGPVMVDVAGLALTAEDVERLRHPMAGSVILFERNYESPAQLLALARAIRAVRSPALPIAVDHEGGRVQRFRKGFTAVPPMRARNLWGTVAYLFMVPNASFPLYPIVDYKTFLRSHYDAPEGPVYARGCQWMVRGLWHLLLYRMIYHFWVIDPSQVESVSGVVQFSMQAYLLYLRVSGQFHLIVGLLHLFGFRLPETHHLYYLASSFTDLWRRINIYWKDFMMKLVYYPSFFRLRKLGNRTGVLASTAIVMFLTWLLHAYQKFWIVGNDPFTRVDTIFWFVLGLLVLGSTVYEQYQPKVARPRAGGWNLRKALGTVMVFGTMAIMWTFWNSDSPGEFVRVMSLARKVDGAGIAMLLALPPTSATS